jgi:hypothetical protein
MTAKAKQSDKEILLKAMEKVVKSPKSIAEMEDEVREFLRSAAPESDQ